MLTVKLRKSVRSTVISKAGMFFQVWNEWLGLYPCAQKKLISGQEILPPDPILKIINKGRLTV